MPKMNYTLHLGDCLEYMQEMESQSVDAIVTDPPYGLGDWNNRGSNAGGPFNSDITQQWDKPIGEEAISEMIRVSKHQIIWGANYHLDYLPRTKQMFIWNKFIRNMHFNDCEIAWTSGWREACRIFDLSPSGLKKEHPTQKPLALMKWCIAKLPANTNVIFDPYMGSGSTGVAAIQLGIKFIGCEINPDYFAIAEKRIAQAALQPGLFTASNLSCTGTATPQGKQPELFSKLTSSDGANSNAVP